MENRKQRLQPCSRLESSKKNPCGEEEGEKGPILRSLLPGQCPLEPVPKDKATGVE